MPTPFARIVKPRYPSAALGLEGNIATLVQVDRGRGNICRLRRAASVTLDESLLRPSFDQLNLNSPSQLAAVLNDLAASAGLLKQKKWSVAIPEESVRTTIVTIETPPGSNAELEQILTWKLERSFGVPLEQLTISRERLPADSQSGDRYLVIAAHTAVLQEYESVFASLGWRAGLLLPRHVGEARWLTSNGPNEDSLLLTSTGHGFTAVVFRDNRPLILRNVSCDPDEQEDELFRLLLFYRDRRAPNSEQSLSRLLVIGSEFPKNRVAELANETLGTNLRPLDAHDVGLELPSRDISFDSIAAPAGLAMLSWH